MIGLLFAGQGSQKKNMGLDFYEKDKKAREFIDNLEDRDEVLKILNLEDDELKRTRNTQIALIAFETMITNLLEDLNIEKVAGLSIGEYAALYKSGVLSLEDTFKIAKYRGQRMEEISRNLKTSMYALMTDDLKLVVETLDELNSKEEFAEISNINTKGQIVISGTESVIDRAVEILKNKNIKSIKLNVSGPFHTSFMSPVQDDLEKFFEEIQFKTPKLSLYLNTTGRIFNNEDLKEEMAEQVRKTVNFKSIIEEMIKDGVYTFIEVGFGNVLSKFVKKIDKNINTISISTYESYLKLRENL